MEESSLKFDPKADSYIPMENADNVNYESMIIHDVDHDKRLEDDPILGRATHVEVEEGSKKTTSEIISENFKKKPEENIMLKKFNAKYEP